MKKKIPYLLVLIVIIGFIVMNTFFTPKEPVTRTYYYLGTIIDIALYEENDELFKKASDLILYYDNLFSRSVESSDIARLNSAGKLTVDDDTRDLIQASLEYSNLSEGYFDITINPIVELWQIGTAEARVPTEDEIIKALEKVDYKNVSVTENEVDLNGSTIDLGGIAKGFITDKLVDLLRDNQIDKALINLGGNVYALGSSATDEDWQIGIRHPEEGRADALMKLSLQDKSIVTSGIYERFFEDEGTVYHHIFDPNTGYPMNNELLSLTVISDKSIDGDALSTALYNLGSQKAFDLADKLSVSIIAVTRDNRLIASKDLKDIIEVFDDNFILELK